MPLLNEFLLSGIVLGFAAGISPGPLLAMTISQTLQHGFGEGIKVAVSPLITDGLIVCFIMLLLLRLNNTDNVLALISFSGAFYLIYLGVSSLGTKGNSPDIIPENTDSLKKGITANFLSPHPYIFWMTVGGPLLFRALDAGILACMLFIAGFYSFLVGSKIVISFLTGRSRHFFTGNYYRNTIRLTGIVYIIFALFFIKHGFELLHTQ